MKKHHLIANYGNTYIIFYLFNMTERVHKSIISFADITLEQFKVLVSNPKYEAEIDWENQVIFYNTNND